MSREAMQMALDALDNVYTTSNDPFHRNACEVLLKALAQPEPEPVAWMHNFIDDVITKNRPTDITLNAGRWTPLYTIPPQREWVGLTIEERIACEQAAKGNYVNLCEAIEDKLKEKNT